MIPPERGGALLEEESMLLAGATELAPDLEDERVDRGLLDRAYNQDLGDCEAIARLISEELGSRSLRRGSGVGATCQEGS